MTRDLWTAQDLARDLGFPGLTPAFWRWCDRAGLPRALQLPGDKVERALRNGRA